mgnify:CR=1
MDSCVAPIDGELLGAADADEPDWAEAIDLDSYYADLASVVGAAEPPSAHPDAVGADDVVSMLRELSVVQRLMGALDAVRPEASGPA